MAIHTCTLEKEGSVVHTSWSKNALKMKEGDSVKFVSEYGDVRLEFSGDCCPFLVDKVNGTVAFYALGKAPLTLKVKKVGRGKKCKFVCLPGSPTPWTGESGGQVPPTHP